MSRNLNVGLESHVSTIKQQLTSPVVAIWEPPVVQQAKAATAPVEIPIEQQLIDTIAAPLHANETSRVGNDRKEREVATLLAQLTPVQSFALSKRLAVNAADDPLVVAFGRMVVDRRNRLIAFLDRLRRGR